MKPTAVLVAIAAALALPSQAPAAVTFVPPGNSSAGEYSDIVPTSVGDRRAESFPGSGSGRGGAPTPNAVGKLNTLGSAGRAAARFAQRTAPTQGQRGSARTGADVRPRALTVAESQDTSPISAIIKRVLGSSSQGGGGLLLPLTLLVAAAVLSAVALVRRRQIS